MDDEMGYLRNISHMSATQRQVLQGLVSADPILSKPRKQRNTSLVDVRKRWERITFKLNRLPGAQKNWKQWRKAWADLHCRLTQIEREKRKTNEFDGENNGNDDNSNEDNDNDVDNGASETDHPSESNQETNESKRSIKTEITLLPEINESSNDSLFRSYNTSYKAPRRKKTSNVNKDEAELAENRMKYILEKELQIKSSYYERKLSLMERQVVALEKIAKATEELDKI